MSTLHEPPLVIATGSRPVVVGCDGSWDSLAAVEVAAREAWRRRTSLAILALPSASRLYADALDEVREREAKAMDRAHAFARRAEARARSTRPALPVEAFVTDMLSAEMQQLARRAALLVLGRHGLGGQSTFSLGSMSGQLSALFEAPVLLAGQGAPGTGVEPHPKVVVGLAGTVEDPILARVALSEALLRRWPLLGVRVVYAATGDRDGTHQMVQAQAEIADTLTVATQAAAVHVRTEVCRGDPIDALTAPCGPSDLLVLGNRGAGRLRGLVPGSRTLRIVALSPCDLLLVPAGEPVEQTLDMVSAGATVSDGADRLADQVDPR